MVIIDVVINIEVEIVVGFIVFVIVIDAESDGCHWQESLDVGIVVFICIWIYMQQRSRYLGIQAKYNVLLSPVLPGQLQLFMVSSCM